MVEPLEYSNPHTNADSRPSTSQSIFIGVLSWGLILVGMALLYVGDRFQNPNITVPFVPFAIAAFLFIFETVLAFYGLLGACIDCHLIRPVWRGIVGLALNLTALWPAVLIIILSAR